MFIQTFGQSNNIDGPRLMTSVPTITDIGFSVEVVTDFGVIISIDNPQFMYFAIGGI